MPTKTLSDDRLAELAAQCLVQLQREETNLLATIQCLEGIRQCALDNDLDGLAELTNSHEQLQSASQAIAEKRGQLRQRLATALGVDQSQATIRRIAELAPAPLDQQLFDARQRLVRLVGRANSLGQSIILLVRQSMDLMREVLECLTGTQRHDGYSRSGARDSGSNPSLLQFRC